MTADLQQIKQHSAKNHFTEQYLELQLKLSDDPAMHLVVIPTSTMRHEPELTT